MHKISSLVFAVAVLIVGGCVTYDPMISAGPFPATSLTEAEIAGIVATVHQGEVDQGNVALRKASSSQVRDLAQMMVNDHSNALSSARDLFARMNLIPVDNTVAIDLQNNTRQTITALETYSGSAFDRQYAQAMVDQHQWVLNTIDTVLLPSVRSAEFRTALNNQRASVARHLEHARRVLAGL